MLIHTRSRRITWCQHIDPSSIPHTSLTRGDLPANCLSAASINVKLIAISFERVFVTLVDNTMNVCSMIISLDGNDRPTNKECPPEPAASYEVFPSEPQ